MLNKIWLTWNYIFIEKCASYRVFFGQFEDIKEVLMVRPWYNKYFILKFFLKTVITPFVVPSPCNWITGPRVGFSIKDDLKIMHHCAVFELSTEKPTLHYGDLDVMSRPYHNK